MLSLFSPAASARTEQEEEKGTINESFVTNMFHSYKERVKRDSPALARGAQRFAPPPPDEQKEIEVPKGQNPGEDIVKDLSSDEFALAHKRLEALGLYSFGADTGGAGAGPDEEKQRELYASALELLGRRDRRERTNFPPPLSHEEMQRKFENMFNNQQNYIHMENRARSRAKWRTVVSYGGGIIVGAAFSYWGLMRVLSENVAEDEEHSFLTQFLFRSGIRMAVDVVIVSAKVFQAFLDPQMTASQKARTAAMGMLKISKPFMSHAIEQGLTVAMGGLLLSPWGAIIGGIIILGTVTASGLITDIIIDRVLIDKNVFKEVVAQQVVTDEMLIREHLQALRELKASQSFDPIGAFTRCLSDNVPLAASMAAVVFEAANPFWFSYADMAMDAVLIRIIIIPRVIKMLGAVWSSATMKRAIQNPASSALRYLRRWKKFDTMWKFLEKYYVLNFVCSLVTQIVSNNIAIYARSYITTGNIRNGILWAYEKKWGKSEVPMKTDEDMMADILKLSGMPESKSVFEAAQRELDKQKEKFAELNKSELTKDEYIAAQRLGEDIRLREQQLQLMALNLQELSDMQKILPQVTGDKSTPTFTHYFQWLRTAERTYRDASTALTLKRLHFMESEEDFKAMREAPGGLQAVAHMAMLTNHKKFENRFDEFTFKDLLEWRASRGYYEKSRAFANLYFMKESALIEAQANAAKNIDNLTKTASAVAMAEAEMVRLNFLTPDQLRLMKTPWPNSIIELFSTRAQLLSDPRGDRARSIDHDSVMLAIISDPEMTIDKMKTLNQGDLTYYDHFIMELKDFSTTKVAVGAEPTPEVFKEWLGELNDATKQKWQETVALREKLANLPKLKEDVDRFYQLAISEVGKKLPRAPNKLLGLKAPDPTTLGSGAEGAAAAVQPSAVGEMPAATTGGDMSAIAQQHSAPAANSLASGGNIYLSPQGNALVNHELRQMTTQIVKNMLTMDFSMAQAVSQTTELITSLFYGGLGALASLVEAFGPPTQNVSPKPGEAGSAPAPNLLKDLSAFNPAKALKCLGKDRFTLGPNTDPAEPGNIPYDGAVPADTDCYTLPYGLQIDNKINQYAYRTANTLATFTGFKLIGTIANLAQTAQKSLRIAAAEKQLLHCAQYISMDMDRVPADQKMQAALCHFANLDLHKACFSPGYSVQDALTPKDQQICSSLAMFADYKDVAPYSNEIRQLVSGTVMAATEAITAESWFGTFKGTAKVIWEGMQADIKMKAAAAQNPRMKKAIEIMYYGSEGISTAVFSNRQLDKLPFTEYVKIAALYARQSSRAFTS